MNLGESDWLLIQKECSNLAKKARISGFRLWIIPELSILLLKIAGSGYEIDIRSDRTGLSPSCIIRDAGPKKVENTSTNHPGCGSQVETGTENWYRKPIYAWIQFCSNPVRSHSYFLDGLYRVFRIF